MVDLDNQLGYRNSTGASKTFAQQPGARFTVFDAPPRLDRPDSSVDLVLLFAVLTCLPSDAGQRKLVAELRRVLRPGGFLYLSDLRLQADPRNRSRYQQFAATYGSYGVSETDDGAVCRHHAADWLDDLFVDFDRVATREVSVATMNAARPGLPSCCYPPGRPTSPTSSSS